MDAGGDGGMELELEEASGMELEESPPRVALLAAICAFGDAALHVVGRWHVSLLQAQVRALQAQLAIP